jgi:hypothetical protein
MGDQTRFWTKWRARFRLCRIAVLLFLLTLVCAVWWLNRIGLPDFLKQPLVDALRQRGVTLQFVRLRWNPLHGLMADNVRLGGKTADSPSLSVEEVHLQINYRALLHRRLQLDGVVLRQGTFTLPVPDTNGPPLTLTLDKIQTELRFQTNDVWSLDNFQAAFAGANFILSGEIAHADAIGDLPIFHRANKTNAVPGRTQSEFRKIARTLNQIHFNRSSQLGLNVEGDARDVNSFSVRLTVSALEPETPWGSAEAVALVARSLMPTHPTNAAPASLAEVIWKARVVELKSDRLDANFISCEGSCFAPTNIQWKAQASGIKTEKFDAGSVSCEGSYSSPTNIEWKAQATGIKSEKLNADFVSGEGSWRAPILELTNLSAGLGGGDLHASVRFNLTTRELSFTNSSCFAPAAIATLLTDKTRARLEQFSLAHPPAFQGSGSLVLPDWTNHSPDVWRTEVQPTVCLAGLLVATNVGLSGLSFDQIHARFIYSNEVWTVPEAVIVRPEGSLQISGTESDVTREYQWHLRGLLSVNIIQPFLTPKTARGFTHFTFADPVLLDTRIRGRLYDYDSISADGHASLEDFSIRGEHVDKVETDFHYANRIASFYHPHMVSGAQVMQGDGVCLDYPGDRIYFTNGLGTADPQKVVNAIGPIPAQVMRPYHFFGLPTARVNGFAPLRDATNADLDFQVVGTAPAGWYKLKTPALSGEIHWIGQSLILTNMTGPFYGGYGSGNAFFDFRPSHSANFSFTADFQNVNIHALATDLNSPTNHLEGFAGGHFVVTSGNSSDWRSCNGYGNANLRDGLIWDVPVFGFLSPVLNSVNPGLGNSRATDAAAGFAMTNGVVSTSKLEIHTTMMRLDYRGTVDLLGDLDADVTAELFRDIPAVGGLLSTVSWPAAKIFESKVTGTIKNPKSKPIYIPKVLLYMLHPIHTLEDLSTPGETSKQ